MGMKLRMMLLSAILGTGCYVQDQPRYVAAGPGPAPMGAPGAVAGEGDQDLVEVSPGVEVIADYNEPVFYADNYYWVNRGGIWYSSTWYGGGWGRAGYISPRLGGIAHPEFYAHYRPNGYIRGGYVNRGGGRVYNGGGGVRVRSAPRVSHHR